MIYSRLTRCAALIVVLVLLSASLLSNLTPTRAATKLLLWHPWKDADAKLLDGWLTDFQTNHPDISIAVQYIPIDDLRNKLETTAPENSPDFIIAPQAWGGILVAENWLAPVDDKIDQELKAQISDPIWASAFFGGKTIGIPINTDSLALYYNNALANPKNLPKSLDDLLTQSRDLTKGDNVGLIMTLDFYPTAGIFFALGGKLMDDNGRSVLNAGTALKDYLTLLKDIYARGQKGELKLNALNDSFKARSAAFIIDGVWNLADYKSALGDKLGVTLLPNVNGNPWSPFFGGTQFFFSARSKNRDAAIAFAKYATSADAQAVMAASPVGRIPVNPQTKIDDRLLAMFAKQVAVGTAASNRAEMSAFWTPMSKAINAVASGGKEINAVIQDTLAAVDKGIEKIQGKPEATATPTAAK